MEGFLNPKIFGYFGPLGFSSYKGHIHTAYIGVSYLHFRYLKCLYQETGAQKPNSKVPWKIWGRNVSSSSTKAPPNSGKWKSSLVKRQTSGRYLFGAFFGGRGIQLKNKKQLYAVVVSTYEWKICETPRIDSFHLPWRFRAEKNPQK